MIRLRLIGSALVSATVVAAALTGAAHAATIADPATRTFTFAGGGVAPPADGGPAGDADLKISQIATFPDDSLLVLEGRARGVVWQVTTAGLLRKIPLPQGPEIDGVSVDASGGVVLVRGNGSIVERLDPVTFRPTRVATLPRSDVRAADVVGLADGTLVVANGAKAWRIAPGAQPREIAKRLRVDAIAALPDAAIAAYDGSRAEIWRVGADGAASRIAAAPARYPLRLASLPDGALVVAGRRVFMASAGGRWRSIGRARWPYELGRAYGDGDGLSRTALRVDAFDVATRSDGSIVVADAGDDPFFSLFDRERLRILVPPGSSPPPLVAAAQSTFSSVGAGLVTYTSTAAGTVRASVFDGSRKVAEGEGPAEVGEGTIKLDRKPPARDLTLRLELQLLGASAVTRVRISAVQNLSRARVRRVLARLLAEREEGDGYSTYWETLGRCTRRSSLRVDCRVLDHFQITGHRIRTRCTKRELVRQRPDGLSVEERRGCGP